MRLLLDTCIFLRLISGDERLAGSVRDEILLFDNPVFLSPVSIWECIVKHQIGKLAFPEPPSVYLPLQRERHGIASLPLDENSVKQLAGLPPIHRDPFDRMLICQAVAHDLTIVTVDRIIPAYPVRTM